MSVTAAAPDALFYGIVNDDLKLLTSCTELLTPVVERGLSLMPTFTDLSQALVRLDDCALTYRFLESGYYTLAIRLLNSLSFWDTKKCCRCESK